MNTHPHSHYYHHGIPTVYSCDLSLCHKVHNKYRHTQLLFLAHFCHCLPLKARCIVGLLIPLKQNCLDRKVHMSRQLVWFCKNHNLCTLKTYRKISKWSRIFSRNIRQNTHLYRIFRQDYLMEWLNLQSVSSSLKYLKCSYHRYSAYLPCNRSDNQLNKVRLPVRTLSLRRSHNTLFHPYTSYKRESRECRSNLSCLTYNTQSHSHRRQNLSISGGVFRGANLDLKSTLYSLPLKAHHSSRIKLHMDCTFDL